MADRAAGIDEEHGARIHPALVVEDAVGLADRTVRPVIGEEWEWQSAELFRPCLEARDGVGTDLQNLYVLLLELFVVLTEPEDLVLSPAGERERHERDHGLAALETAQAELLVYVRRKLEIRRLRSWLQSWHTISFSVTGDSGPTAIVTICGFMR